MEFAEQVHLVERHCNSVQLQTLRPASFERQNRIISIIFNHNNNHNLFIIPLYLTSKLATLLNKYKDK